MFWCFVLTQWAFILHCAYGNQCIEWPGGSLWSGGNGHTPLVRHNNKCKTFPVHIHHRMHIQKCLNLEKELLIMCCIKNKDKEIKQVQIKTCIIPLSFFNKCYLSLSSISCKAQISWQWQLWLEHKKKKINKTKTIPKPASEATMRNEHLGLSVRSREDLSPQLETMALETHAYSSQRQFV